MNSRMIYVDGVRLPAGVATVSERRGLNSKQAKVEIPKEFIDGHASVSLVSVDEFYSGRLAARYEFNAKDEDAKMDTNEKAFSFICKRCPSEGMR